MEVLVLLVGLYLPPTIPCDVVEARTRCTTTCRTIGSYTRCKTKCR
jgi:hypothetical protein